MTEPSIDLLAFDLVRPAVVNFVGFEELLQDALKRIAACLRIGRGSEEIYEPAMEVAKKRSALLRDLRPLYARRGSRLWSSVAFGHEPEIPDRRFVMSQAIDGHIAVRKVRARRLPKLVQFCQNPQLEFFTTNAITLESLEQVPYACELRHFAR